MNELATMKAKTGFKQTEVGLIPEDWEVNILPQIRKLLTRECRKVNKINALKTFLFPIFSLILVKTL